MRLRHVLPAVCMLLVATASSAAGLAPWQLGMSKAEVSSFTEFGPYKAFSNGDLETFGGIYAGSKENVQFFFNQEGLRRIGVYLYEGTEAQAARVAWRRAYESLQEQFGTIETPSISIAQGSSPVDLETLSIAAAANVSAVGKTQMAPVMQPQGMSVFSSFGKRAVNEADYYYVIVYFDRKP